MKCALAILVVVAALAAMPAFAEPPQSSVDPTLNFLVARELPNGSQIVLATYALEAGYTTDAAVRSVVMQYVSLQRLNNPSWHIILYGPTDWPPSCWSYDPVTETDTFLCEGQTPPYWTSGDRVWDSTVSY